MTSATRHPAHPVLGGQSPMRLEPLGSLRRRKRAQHGCEFDVRHLEVVRLLTGVGSRLPEVLLVSCGLCCVRSHQGDSPASVRSTRSRSWAPRQGTGATKAAGEDVRVTRLVTWWIGLAASVVLVVAALASQSGTCVDSANAAASSCRSGGSGGLLLLGLAAMALSVWMLRRTYWTQRLRGPRR